ncbi:MAG: FAD-binding oxidoreductase, partial [Clostridia bacterium]|nr:FAD-binding oxidoreductase [Clostridia bacterium]
MESVWSKTSLPQFETLKGDAKTDVLIIGGGLAGILTAYFLKQNGVNYILVEKDRICGENTKNTTAKITAQHGLIYGKLLKSGGVDLAQNYLKANISAFYKYKELCAGIDCDYEIRDNYVYSFDREKLEREMGALSKIGYKAEFCEKLPLPIDIAGAVKFPKQAQFNPLKFVKSVASGLNIYENTFVREMKGNTAVTPYGNIKAQKVICATHFPFINKHGNYFLKLYQHRSYVIAYENAPNVDGMYVDDNDNGFSFRNYKDLLLVGGGGGRTGKNNGGWNEIREFAKKNYPKVREKYFWAAQDCMSLDGLYYIGRYSPNTPSFFVETGFNKWGM